MDTHQSDLGSGFSSLPSDPQDRHEAMVDLFGECIMWLREWTLQSSRDLIESPEARDKLGAIQRRKYTAVAELPIVQQQACCKFAEASVDRFIQFLLTMLSGTGVDQRVGEDYAIRFKLQMELLNLVDQKLIHEEVINRGGGKYFADYWGRWINRAKPEEK